MADTVKSIFSNSQVQSMLAATLAVAAIKYGSQVKGVRVLTGTFTSASLAATAIVASGVLVTGKALYAARKSADGRKKNIGIAFAGLSVIVLTGLLVASNVTETKFKSLPKVDGNQLKHLAVATLISSLIAQTSTVGIKKGANRYEAFRARKESEAKTKINDSLQLESIDKAQLLWSAKWIRDSAERQEFVNRINQRADFLVSLKELQNFDPANQTRDVLNEKLRIARELKENAAKKLGASEHLTSTPAEASSIDAKITSIDTAISNLPS